MINTLNQIIVGKLGPLGPIMIVAGLGLVLVIISLPLLLQRRPDPMERLQKSVKAEAEQKKKSRDQALRTNDRNDKLEKFATFLEPQNEKDMSDARLQMLRAGYRSKNAVRTFHAVQFIAGVGALIAGVIYTVILNQSQTLGLQAEMLYTLLPGALGYYAPKRYVQQRVQKRQNEIINGFPDALDMMLVCVEAGQSLDQSIMRVAREMRTGYPALSEEFELVSHEVRAGKERISVLRDMSERVGVPDVASFVTVMIQSASFGTSIAEALRVFSAEMRDKRVMRAEEKANTIPTKLTLGTMMFTVPPLMVVLIGPSLYNIVQMMSGNH